MMRRPGLRHRVIGGVLFLLLATSARSGGPIPASVDEVARTVVSYFPEVATKVLYVEGDRVVLDAGAKIGLTKGMIVHLFREGAAFAHPLSGQELGHFEKDLGRVEITETSESISKGIRIGPQEEARPGDGARFSARRIPVAIVPIDPAADKVLLQDLRFSLEESGRLRVIDPSDVAKALIDGKVERTPEGIRKAVTDLGTRLGVEYLVLVDGGDGGRTWTAALVSTPRGTPVATLGPIGAPDAGGAKAEEKTGTVIAPAAPPIAAAAPAPEKAAPPQEPLRAKSVTVLPLEISGAFIRVADVDGDGKPEIVVSDGLRVRIYRVEAKELKLVWEEKPYRNDQEHLWLDVADINGNGVPEIFVTSRWGGRLHSYIVEHTGGGFSRVVEDLPLYLRVVPIPGEGERLLAQRSGTGSPYVGGVYVYEWKKDRYVRSRRIALPKDQSIFGFTFVGEAKDRDILGYSEDDHLIIHRADGKRLFRSPERFEGNRIEFEQKDRTSPLGDGRERMVIHGRIETVSGNLVVYRNVSLTPVLRGLPAYRGAEVIGLNWDGSSLATRWSIPQIDGFIADLAVGNVDGDGKPQVVLLTHPTVTKSSVEWKDVKNMIQGHSEVLIYVLSEGTL